MLLSVLGKAGVIYTVLYCSANIIADLGNEIFIVEKIDKTKNFQLSSLSCISTFTVSFHLYCTK